jgi:hypothetical protein
VAASAVTALHHQDGLDIPDEVDCLACTSFQHQNPGGGYQGTESGGNQTEARLFGDQPSFSIDRDDVRLFNRELRFRGKVAFGPVRRIAGYQEPLPCIDTKQKCAARFNSDFRDNGAMRNTGVQDGSGAARPYSGAEKVEPARCEYGIQDTFNVAASLNLCQPGAAPQKGA